MNLELDMRHRSIIDALPTWEVEREVLTVGCGSGKIDAYLLNQDYKVWSTDYGLSPEQMTQRDAIGANLNFTHSDIFDLSTFPIEGCETVICSEVLEHLDEWEQALRNLLILTKRRLIITVPWAESYDDTVPPPIGHCNYWTDIGEDPFPSLHAKRSFFKPIHQFSRLAFPWHVSITKLHTKEHDWFTASRDYLIIIDKMQFAEFCPNREALTTRLSLVKKEDGRYDYIASAANATFAAPPPYKIGPSAVHIAENSIFLFGRVPGSKQVEIIDKLAFPWQAHGMRVHWWDSEVRGLEEVKETLQAQIDFFKPVALIVTNLENMNFSALALALNMSKVPVFVYSSDVEKNKSNFTSYVSLVDANTTEWNDFVEGVIMRLKP